MENLLPGYANIACRSMVCTPSSKLGQMAHDRKGRTTPKGGSSPAAARALAEWLAIYHSLRKAVTSQSRRNHSSGSGYTAPYRRCKSIRMGSMSALPCTQQLRSCPLIKLLTQCRFCGKIIGGRAHWQAPQWLASRENAWPCSTTLIGHDNRQREGNP